MFTYFDKAKDQEIQLTIHDIYFLFVLLTFNGKARPYDIASELTYYEVVTEFDFFKNFLKTIKSCPNAIDMHGCAVKLEELGLVKRELGRLYLEVYRPKPETHFLLYWLVQKSENPEITFTEAIDRFLDTNIRGLPLPDDHWNKLLEEGYISQTRDGFHGEVEPKESWEIVYEHLKNNLKGMALIYQPEESGESIVVGIK